MLRGIWTLGAVALLSAGLCAAEQKTISGYLIDKACSADVLKKGEKAAKEHSLDCALMEDCVKSGYGVFTADGKYVAFDAAGNKKALAALKASKKQNDIRVTVTGDQTGDTIKVTTLKLN